MASGIGHAKNDVLDLVVDSATGLEGIGLRVRREIVEVGLKEPEGLERVSISSDMRRHPAHRSFQCRHTKSAAVTDSSHKSNKNSSRAIDSLSTLIIRWHSCGKKNSISS